MSNAQSIRDKRRSTAKSMYFVAIGGIVLTLIAAATAIWLGYPDHSAQVASLSPSN